ncbi:MAG: hypothetical protein JXA57_06050 [Armatimonadetes bacterium]|nr:hypothetical protein [Armatimonadota bacterium]
MERLLGRISPRLASSRVWLLRGALVVWAFALLAASGCRRAPDTSIPPKTYEEAMALVEEGERHLEAAETVPLEQESAELQQAVACGEGALQFLDEQQRPEDWAETHLLLATCFLRLLSQDEQNTADRVIEHAEAALQVYTEDNHPDDWARANASLAAALLKRTDGDPARNLEEARRALQATLDVWTRESSPEDWALTMFLLAAHAKVTEHREDVIKYSRAALSVLRRDTEPDRYGTLSFVLGESLLLNKEGDRGQNLRQARRHLEDALNLWEQRRGTKEYAWASFCLGACYMQLTGGDADDHAQNWEQAIAHFREALRVYTEADDPEYWATVSADLGVSFSVRVYGDREENLAQARRHLQDALRVLPEDEDLQPLVKAYLACAVARSSEATDADLVEARAMLSDATRALEVNGDPRYETILTLLARTAERLTEELDE